MSGCPHCRLSVACGAAAKLAVIGAVVPFWNPFSNTDRVQNLQRCLALLRAEAGVRVLCVEMRCGPLTGLADVVLEPGCHSKYIWQKERLVNHGCSLLVGDGLAAVGYVDSDVLFQAPGWAERIARVFDGGQNLVQAFSTAGTPPRTVASALTAYPRLPDRMHGGAMFLDAALFQSAGGLYEHCIVGGGDFALLMAVTGELAAVNRVFPSEPYRAHFRRWMERVNANGIRPAAADNGVDILPHGNFNRSHRLRHALLQDFDPHTDIVHGDTLSLSEAGARLLPRLRVYCAHREDRADVIQRQAGSHAGQAGA